MTTDEATDLAARLTEVPGLEAEVNEDGTIGLTAKFGAKVVIGEEGVGLGDKTAEQVEINLRMGVARVVMDWMVGGIMGSPSLSLSLLQQWVNMLIPMAKKELAGKLVVASDVPKEQGGLILRPGDGAWGKGGGR